MSEAREPDPLQPALRKAQAELAKLLARACSAKAGDLDQSSVEQLLHLEEQLLAAARAADEAARLQRRLDERDAAAWRSASAAQPADAPEPESDEPVGRVREFRDGGGRAWRVWEVRPALSRPVRELHRYLGDYVDGWLAFGCLDEEMRKRLPNFPPGWLQMPDGELETLLLRATDVPARGRES